MKYTKIFWECMVIYRETDGFWLTIAIWINIVIAFGNVWCDHCLEFPV